MRGRPMRPGVYMSRQAIDLTGQKFHDLTVLKRASSNRQGSSTWVCLCSCGEYSVYSSDHLTRKKGSVKSCGCKRVKSGKDHPHVN